MIAAAITYLSWPYLWQAPLTRYWQSSVTMTDFPGGGRVLFDGAVYAANELPRFYFPTLVGIQLTEPALDPRHLGDRARGQSICPSQDARPISADARLVCLPHGVCGWIAQPTL